jgi:hypothetical protein
MKAFIDTYLSYIKAALVTLLCATTIFFISAVIRSTSIFFTGNSSVSIDILSVVSGVLLFALIGFGIVWGIISLRSRRSRVLETKGKENLNVIENQKILLRHRVAYFLIALFALNTSFTLVIVFLVGFGVIGLQNSLLITILGLTTAQVGAVFGVVTKYLFPGRTFYRHSNSGYDEVHNSPKTKEPHIQSMSLKH